MACTDCLKNCPQIVSDKCVETTIASDSYPLLGICQGDSLFQVEKVILDKLTEVVEGEGIVLSDIDLTNCQFLLDILGVKDKTLFNLIQMLVDASCSLKESIADLEETPFSFTTSCLTGLPANPTSDQILQAALNKLCAVSATVDAIPTTYVKISDLENQVLQIITEQEAATPIQFKNRMVPFAATPYFGPLSNFDVTGKGVTSLGFDKVYLCNGLNGTPDLRGRTVVGAVVNVPGGTLDTEVSPSNPLNIQNVNYTLNQKFGVNFHKLSVQESPSHGHGITDPGHTHPVPQFYARSINYGNENSTKVLQQTSGHNSSLVSPTVVNAAASAQTGISVGATGGDQPHENRQPSIAAYWIIHLP